MKAYAAYFYGDICDLRPIAGRTLDDVLVRIRETHGFGQCKSELISDDELWHTWKTPDPEDDKIEVWELDLDTGEARVVWGFFGWHWPMPEGLEQGTLPGNPDTLYALAMNE